MLTRSQHRADVTATIVSVTTMVAVPVADTAQMKRLTEFAADVNRLADERADLELRELIDAPHGDLLLLRGDDDG
jgi:hypothetical protein